MTNRARDQPISPLLEHPNRACAGADPTLFFPHDGETNRDAIARMRPAAIEFCAHCPIRDACRDEGETQGFGLWGGILYRPKGGTLARNSIKKINLLTGREIA